MMPTDRVAKPGPPCAWIVVLGTVVLALASPTPASAGCCRLVKIDDETPVVPVRACASGGDASCPSPTFEETIEIGVYHDVCVATPSLVYQEWDPAAAAFAPGVEAVCDGEI